MAIIPPARSDYPTRTIPLQEEEDELLASWLLLPMATLASSCSQAVSDGVLYGGVMSSDQKTAGRQSGVVFAIPLEAK